MLRNYTERIVGYDAMNLDTNVIIDDLADGAGA